MDENKLKIIIKRLRELDTDKKIKFIVLFGSHANGYANSKSDIDLAIYYDSDKKSRAKFRIKVLGKLTDSYDIQIFQDLPLYVRIEVLKGKVLYNNIYQDTFDIYMDTINEYERFKPRLDMYYKAVEAGL